MIKLIQNSGLLIKSHDYYVIFNFILGNPELTFDIIIGYRKISHNDFCKLFLTEIRNYEDYATLESILNRTKTIYEYVQF